MKCTPLITILFSLISTLILGQNISGNVKSKSDASPLAFANVFLNNTQIATNTDEKGVFLLSNIEEGTYELLVSYIGYEVHREIVEVNQENIHLNITLVPKKNQLEEVVVKEDKNWQSHYSFFIKSFIGSTPYANYCKITNPDIVDLYFDYDSSVLEVSTEDFLIIENRALGYRIKYLLQDFRHYRRTGYQIVLGYSIFEELEGSRRKKIKWKKRRKKAYSGSLSEFYKVLNQNTWQKEGYLIRKLERKANPNRLAQDSIRKVMKSLFNLGYTWDSDTLQYWLEEDKKPKIVEIISPELVKTDTLWQQYKQYSLLQFPDYWLIIYTKEKEHALYLTQKVRKSRKASYQTSVITLTEEAAIFDKNGSLINPLSVRIEGYWAWQEKIAEMLPVDYRPKQE